MVQSSSSPAVMPSCFLVVNPPGHCLCGLTYNSDKSEEITKTSRSGLRIASYHWNKLTVNSSLLV
eukprot:scaffold48969_cov19-Prasinocladus_malaysianus.AAC.1